MGGQLKYTMFYDLLLPKDIDEDAMLGNLKLAKVLRYQPSPLVDLHAVPLVIFDFETTGLHKTYDRIIEIGALKVYPDGRSEEFQTLVQATVLVTEEITKLTGITREMLQDAPKIEDTLPQLLQFIDGSILVAHNAEFDMGFLKAEALRIGYDVDLPCLCTLKMARELLPDLNSRNLDTLAEHYGLQFEARHRSIGDCKVTHSVLNSLLCNEGQTLRVWQDMTPYTLVENG